MGKLTDNQKRFIDEYLIDLNATRAYKAVYQRVKKDEVAAAASARLLRNVKVQKYLMERQKALQERTEITQDKVIQELARIGFADIKDYLSYRTEKTVITTDKDTGEPIIDYSPIIEVLNSDQVDGKVIQEVSINSKGVFTFKLYNKLDALDKIGKILGLFKDKLELSGNINNPYEGLTTEELKDLLKKL
ncbi:terminase small subunit [Clostridiisalibacter paucivorans]|uniref:terminase small subunit n=1 Tax=Clostridiisalibacter paucivorans TaxID=408753 RepID=UPI0006850A9B|nr:terminase small subunit [Clostridiisalibacter paucivorans]